MSVGDDNFGILISTHADGADFTDAALCLLRKRAQPIKSVVMYATGHYTATKVAYLHGLYPLRRIYLISQSATRPVSDENEQPMR